MEAEFEGPIDPYKAREVTFVSYEDAGFTMEEILRLCMRGFEVQCFKMPGDSEDTIRMNFPITEESPAQRFRDAMNNGTVEEADVYRFLSDARFIESDVTFNLAWSDFV